jgi:hypothetical protein
MGAAPPSRDPASAGVLGLALRPGPARRQGLAEGWSRDAERHFKVGAGLVLARSHWRGRACWVVGGPSCAASPRSCTTQPLQEALGLCPRATWVAVLLTQLLLASDRGDAALQLARSCAAASPQDADAATLLALVLQQHQQLQPRAQAGGGSGSGRLQRQRQQQQQQQQQQQRGGGGRHEQDAAVGSGGGGTAAEGSAHEVRDECLRAVRLDPWAYGALSGEQCMS